MCCFQCQRHEREAVDASILQRFGAANFERDKSCVVVCSKGGKAAKTHSRHRSRLEQVFRHSARRQMYVALTSIAAIFYCLCCCTQTGTLQEKSTGLDRGLIKFRSPLYEQFLLRLRNDLYCVGWGVKLYTHSLTNNFSNYEYDIIAIRTIFLSHSDTGGPYLLLENAL